LGGFAENGVVQWAGVNKMQWHVKVAIDKRYVNLHWGLPKRHYPSWLLASLLISNVEIQRAESMQAWRYTNTPQYAFFMCPASRTLSGACRALRSWDAGRTACAWHVKEATLWPVTTQRHQIRSATCSLVGEILKPLGCPVYTGVPASPLYPIASWSYRASPPLARQLSGELQFLAEKRP